MKYTKGRFTRGCGHQKTMLTSVWRQHLYTQQTPEEVAKGFSCRAGVRLHMGDRWRGTLAGDQGELYLKNTLPGDLCTPNQIDCVIKILTDKATRSVMQTDLYEDKAALSMLETAPALVTWEIMKCRSRLKSSKIGALDGSPLNHFSLPPLLKRLLMSFGPFTAFT